MFCGRDSKASKCLRWFARSFFRQKAENGDEVEVVDKLCVGRVVMSDGDCVKRSMELVLDGDAAIVNEVRFWLKW